MAGAFCFPVAGAVSFFLGFPSAVCAQFCCPLCVPCSCPRELCTDCAPQPAGNWQGWEGHVRDSGTPWLQLLDKDDLHNTLAFQLSSEWGWPRMLVKFQRTFLIFPKFPVSLWESVFFLLERAGILTHPLLFWSLSFLCSCHLPTMDFVPEHRHCGKFVSLALSPLCYFVNCIFTECVSGRSSRSVHCVMLGLGLTLPKPSFHMSKKRSWPLLEGLLHKDHIHRTVA